MEKLILDPGHGGTDPGTCNHGYMEKELNLVIAKRVKELLKEFNPAMTRETDKTLGPTTRANMVKDKYEYCISIHLNAGGGTGIVEIHSAQSEKGKKMAEYIAESTSEKTGVKIRNIFSKVNSKGSDWYYMNRETGSTVTVITESLFLDSLEDIKHLNVENIAQGIAEGFKKFIEESEGKNMTITKTLKFGMVDEEVKTLQEILKKECIYMGAIDGSFGPATMKAVQVYQQRNGLEADGSVGPLTRNVINGVKKN